MTGAEQESSISIRDLIRLVEIESPELPGAVLELLALGDEWPTDPPEGAVHVSTFMSQLASARSRRRRRDRREQSEAAWARFLKGNPLPPPERFSLPELLVALYDRKTESSRALLLQIIENAPLRFGLWGGLKRLFKRVEAELDLVVWGALVARFDEEAGGYSSGREVSSGTLYYLRNRAWRFLRGLARSTPALYAQASVEALRHYREGWNLTSTWIATHVFVGKKSRDKFGARHYESGRLPENLVKDRAFADAWKISPDPLMVLLETCRHDTVASFAIQSLRADFPEALRGVTPAWIERLTRRRLASAHEFVVDTLEASAEFHQAKLKGLGLHDAVLSLLISPSAKARKYAIAYARANARDLSNEFLANLVYDHASEGARPAETRQFAGEILKTRDPRAMGLAFLGELLDTSELSQWAQQQLEERFERSEITTAFLVAMIFGDGERQIAWATKYIDKRYPDGEIGSSFWTAILDDPRASKKWRATDAALRALAKMPVTSIAASWLVQALGGESRVASAVSGWMAQAKSLPGLDVERLKGFVLNPQYRDFALAVINNRKVVKPGDLGLAWLLALARRPDPSLSNFASRYLLEHMQPADFSDGDKASGVSRLFAMAMGEKEPENIRVFAQTYLRCHHPDIGPLQAETQLYALKPQLDRGSFSFDVVWLGMFDNRADVRRFATVVVKSDLRRWGEIKRVFELADSEAKEVRTVAFDALLKAGDPAADSACTLTVDELEASPVLGMIESRRRATRDVGMQLLEKHYARLGGPDRVAWLMQSPDREVRSFAVELLWARHRPRSLPKGWAPHGKTAGGDKSKQVPASDAALPDDLTQLRGLLRRVMFTLPPGRLAEAPEGASRRRASAGEVKRHLVELIRELAVRDAAFAYLVMPVFEELSASLATGEWQASLSAWMTIRRAHPQLVTESTLTSSTSNEARLGGGAA
ncbi:MAG: hypothetical protein U0165_19755 [Polyangiaceae bacterium]